MEKSLTCFLPFSDTASVKSTVASLRESGIVRSVFIIVPPGNEETFKVPGAGQIVADSFVSTEALKKDGSSCQHFPCPYLQQGLSP